MRPRPQGAYKILLVPADSIHETEASRAAGTAYVAARHGGDERTITGPFEVVGEITADQQFHVDVPGYGHMGVIG